jgi:hypothetical protein
MSYAKLYSSILDSSIWSEDDTTRIVWITMLAMATRNGIVHASEGGLARRANVSVEDCRRALGVLASPDSDDKSGVMQGVRVIPMQGCWQLVNFEFYREVRSIDAVRKSQWRERNQKGNSECPGQSQMSPPDTAPTPAPEASPEGSISSKPDGSDAKAAQVREVFEHWRAKLGSPKKKLTGDRDRRIRARLREGFTVEQLKTAVDGVLLDDWLMGRDPKTNGKNWTGVDTIFKSGSKVEYLVELAEGKRSGRSRPGSKQRDHGLTGFENANIIKGKA